MPYPKEKITLKDIGIAAIIVIIPMFFLALILLGFIVFKDTNTALPQNAIAESTQ